MRIDRASDAALFQLPFSTCKLFYRWHSHKFWNLKNIWRKQKKCIKNFEWAFEKCLEVPKKRVDTFIPGFVQKSSPAASFSSAKFSSRNALQNFCLFEVWIFLHSGKRVVTNINSHRGLKSLVQVNGFFKVIHTFCPWKITGIMFKIMIIIITIMFISKEKVLKQLFKKNLTQSALQRTRLELGEWVKNDINGKNAHTHMHVRVHTHTHTTYIKLNKVELVRFT